MEAISTSLCNVELFCFYSGTCIIISGYAVGKEVNLFTKWYKLSSSKWVTDTELKLVVGKLCLPSATFWCRVFMVDQ